MYYHKHPEKIQGREAQFLYAYTETLFLPTYKGIFRKGKTPQDNEIRQSTSLAIELDLLGKSIEDYEATVNWCIELLKEYSCNHT